MSAPNCCYTELVVHTGEKIYGKVLNITESMIGQNMWKCTSTNVIDNRPHNTSTMVVFTVPGIGKKHIGVLARTSPFCACCSFK